LATSRICEAPNDWTAARADGVKTGERIEDLVAKSDRYTAAMSIRASR
jgi:hypothetical protein